MKFEDMAAREMMNTLDERLSHYSANLSKHHFSLAYRIRRYQTINSASQGSKVSHRFTVKRVRYVLLAVILTAFLLTGFTVLFTIGRFTLFDYNDHSAIFLSRSPDDKTKIESIYGLSEEANFSLSSREIYDNDVFSLYQSGDKKVTFCQMVNDDVHNLNTEYGVPEEVMISGCKGIFISENNGECFAAWIMDGYLFTISGNVDKKMLLNLAETTKIENK